jgi:hypothetical protein
VTAALKNGSNGWTKKQLNYLRNKLIMIVEATRKALENPPVERSVSPEKLRDRLKSKNPLS